MSWKRRMLIKLHPQQVLDCLVEVITWIMETWALVRVLIIFILVLSTMLMYVRDNIPAADDLNQQLGQYYEDICDDNCALSVFCNSR